MSPQRKKGLLRLLGVAVFVAVVAAVVFFWPFKSDNTPGTEAEAAPKPSPSATAPDQTTLYFNGVSKAIKAGDLQQQSQYVANNFRADFIQGDVLMFPKGTTVKFERNTLVADSKATGHIKAVASTNGTTTHYVVLLDKETDSTGRSVWHISHTEKVNG